MVMFLGVHSVVTESIWKSKIDINFIYDTNIKQIDKIYTSLQIMYLN